MSRYYDRQGTEISLDEWVTRLQEPGYRTMARTEIGTTTVSTVWLGSDHGHGDSIAIFETLVINGALADEMTRYATEGEALAGHHQMVHRVHLATIGHRIAARALERFAESAAEDEDLAEWGDYPDIGAYDWTDCLEAGVQALQGLRLDVDDTDYRAAYDRLAEHAAWDEAP